MLDSRPLVSGFARSLMMSGMEDSGLSVAARPTGSFDLARGELYMPEQEAPAPVAIFAGMNRDF